LRSSRLAFRIASIAFVAALLARPSNAQEAPDNGGAVFLPRAAFAFAWGSLITDDRRFDWQGRIAADFDIVTVDAWRVSFRAEYEAMLGRERRRYDLNQGNYFFDAALGRRAGGAEVQAIIQHVSRHVVDRENVPAISWNLIGARVRSSLTWGGDRRVEGEIEAGRFMQPAFIDYVWATRAQAAVHEPLTDRLSLVGRANAELIGVHRDIYDRPRVCGGRVELALRVRGHAASVEVFAGYERRVDAFPTDRFRVRWFTVGFRVVQ
jgi:hypothetical protein